MMALFALATLPLAGEARADSLIQVDLPAGSAEQALMKFLRQEGIATLFPHERLSALQVPAITGRRTRAQVLNEIFKNTGLTWRFKNEHLLLVSEIRERRLTAPAARPSQPAPESHDSDVKPKEQDEVTITTARERRPETSAAGTTHLSSAAIERQGFGSTPEALKASVQNFGGGATPDTQRGPEAQSNISRGSSPNLRGLGSGATLVLLNGQRMAPSGLGGLFVDVSSIPLSVIDSIDIQPGGADARFGVDAVAGVVNIHTKQRGPGFQTVASYAATARGGPQEAVVTQTGSFLGSRTSGLLTFEYAGRDALEAATRAQARSDLRQFGGDNFDSLASSPGTILIGSQTWAIPRGQDGRSLQAADLAAGTRNFHNLQDGADITPAERRWSTYSTISWSPNGLARESSSDEDSSKGLNPQFYTNALLSERTVHQWGPAADAIVVVTPLNPYYVNPAGGSQPVRVAYNLGRELGLTQYRTRVRTANFLTGVNFSAFRGWLARGSIGYSLDDERQNIDGQIDLSAFARAVADPNPDTAFDLFGDGAQTNPRTVEAIRAHPYYLVRSSMFSINGDLDGTLMQWPAGTVAARIGGSWRRQHFISGAVGDGWQPDARVRFDRDVLAAFAEIELPLIGKDQRFPGIEKLALCLAIRGERDDYIGGAMLPQFCLRVSPSSSVSVDAQWTRSYRAPSPADVAGHSSSVLVALPDPTSPTGVTPSLVRTGANRDLRAETASSWSIGVDIRPQRIPTLLLALRSFGFVVRNRAERISLFTNVLTDPRYGEIITRHPSASEVQAACGESAIEATNTLGCITAPIGAIIDGRLRNRETVWTSGVDVAAQYQWAVPMGAMTARLDGTYVFDYSRASDWNAPRESLLDTPGNPLSRRLRGTLEFSRNRFQAGLSLNFSNAYDDNVSLPTRRVSSSMTYDANFSYVTAGGGRFTLSVTNLTDKNPPFVNNPLGIGYDQENGDLQGRVIHATAGVNW